MPSLLDAVVKTTKISRIPQATRGSPPDDVGTVWFRFGRVKVFPKEFKSGKLSCHHRRRKVQSQLLPESAQWALAGDGVGQGAGGQGRGRMAGGRRVGGRRAGVYSLNRYLTNYLKYDRHISVHCRSYENKHHIIIKKRHCRQWVYELTE